MLYNKITLNILWLVKQWDINKFGSMPGHVKIWLVYISFKTGFLLHKIFQKLQFTKYVIMFGYENAVTDKM